MNSLNYSKWTAENVPPQHGRFVVITAGKRAMGFAVARVPAGRGASIVPAVRDTDKNQKPPRESRTMSQAQTVQFSSSIWRLWTQSAPRRPSHSQDSIESTTEELPGVDYSGVLAAAGIGDAHRPRSCVFELHWNSQPNRVLQNGVNDARRLECDAGPRL